MDKKLLHQLFHYIEVPLYAKISLISIRIYFQGKYDILLLLVKIIKHLLLSSQISPTIILLYISGIEWAYCKESGS